MILVCCLAVGEGATASGSGESDNTRGPTGCHQSGGMCLNINVYLQCPPLILAHLVNIYSEFESWIPIGQKINATANHRFLRT